VILGAFSQRSNAERLHKIVSEKDYAPLLISFRNGLIAVGVCPVNSLQEAMQCIRKVREESFCPADVWILDNV
jgi:hypothetical protein